MSAVTGLLARFLGPAGLLLALAGSVARAAQIGPPGLGNGALLAGLALCAAAAILNRRTLARILLGGGARAGTGTALYALTVLGFVVLVNFIADRHHWRRDLTVARSWTLSEVTRNVVRELDGPVRILGFFREGGEAAETPLKTGARLMLREYDYLSGKLRVEIIDPLREPGLARTHISINQDPALVVVKGDRIVQATSPDEDGLTGAIIAASRRQRKTVCFLSGHGERLPEGGPGGYSRAAEDLARLFYQTREVLLTREGAVPEGCDLLVVAGPQSALAEPEIEILRAYLDGGGRLLAMIEPLSPERLDALLEPWGLKARAAVIADKKVALGTSIYSPVVSAFESHAISRSLAGSQTLHPTVAPVDWFETKDQLIFHEVLARAGRDAWGESDLQGVREGRPPSYDSASDPLDQASGLSIGAVAWRPSWKDEAAGPRPEGTLKQETRIVLLGDSDFASDEFYASQSNRSLFLNAVGWLAQEEVLLGVQPAESRERTTLPGARALRRLELVLYAPPVALALIGLLVWLRRRRL